MYARVTELLAEVMKANDLVVDDFISILFTVTSDLHSAFPAVAARTLGFNDVPLMCARELEITGSLPRAVRLMAHVETDLSKSEVAHVYQYGSEILRPDLVRRDA